MQQALKAIDIFSELINSTCMLKIDYNFNSNIHTNYKFFHSLLQFTCIKILQWVHQVRYEVMDALTCDTAATVLGPLVRDLVFLFPLVVSIHLPVEAALVVVLQVPLILVHRLHLVNLPCN